jgi:hypothetical protein
MAGGLFSFISATLFLSASRQETMAGCGDAVMR